MELQSLERPDLVELLVESVVRYYNLKKELASPEHYTTCKKDISLIVEELNRRERTTIQKNINSGDSKVA
jgi:hypothetical protein